MFTIGHSTRSIEEFISLLKENKIALLADVRRYPGSRRFPHFGGEELEKHLYAAGIDYMHFSELGGRRQPLKNSENTAWKHKAFRGYADYMQTPEFKNGIERLLQAQDHNFTAIMCSEAVWWSCHRSLISDYLKAAGIEVLHIMGEGKIQEHPYTKPARIVDGKLSYKGEGELF